MADNRPPGVSALGILALCLGIMGVLGGGAGIAGLFISAQTGTQAGGNPKMAEVNAEFQQKVEQFRQETRKNSIVTFAILMAISALLAIGGIAALQLKALGFVKLAFAASLLADTAGAIYNVAVQLKMMGIMKWYSKEMAAASNMPAMDMVMSISTYTGLFFGIGWMIAKAAFYIVGLVYFSKSKVKEAFEGGPAPSPQP